MNHLYNNSSRSSIKSSASMYEDVSHVSHVTKPVMFENMLEPAIPIDQRSNNDKIYRVNLNILPVVFLEMVALGCLGALAYVMRFTDKIPVFTRLTNCFSTKENYSIPFGVSTFANVFINIDYTTFYAVCTFTPLGVILLGEIGCLLFSKNRKVIRGGCVSCRLYLPVRRLVRFCGVFIFGLFTVSIITDGLKLSTGRMRPYYPYVCESSLNEKDLRYAMISFPSYYASISSYSSAYLMAYLHFILSVRASRLMRPSLIFTLGAIALLCGASRVALHYNHWEDVVVGNVIGVAAAVYLTFATLECFGQRVNMLVQAYNQFGRPNMEDEEEKPLFFRYFRIPHVSYQNRTGMPYPENMQVQSPLLLENDFRRYSRTQNLKRDGSNHI